MSRDRRAPGAWFAYSLSALLALTTVSSRAQEMSDPWMILASGEKGSINARTTHHDLVRMYGAANVVDQDVDIGEGEMQPATFLFSKDPERQIEIRWKDPDTKTAPESADIRGKKSRWHAAHGITMGTSASELERMNGRPFHFSLANDGTDMREETISWRGGSLEIEFQGYGRVILELEWSPAKADTQTGPRDIEVNSDNPAWRAQNPRVSRITWLFPSKTQP